MSDQGRRKPASDSLKGKIELEYAEKREYRPPDDMPPLVGSEKSIWNQYISSKFEWDEKELRTVHKIVKLESQYQDFTKQAENYPRIYEKSNGDLAPHPFHAEVRQVHKALMSEIRNAGLNPKPGDNRRANAPVAGQSNRGKKMKLVG